MLEQLKRAWQAGSKDNIGIIAAGMAYYALLALIPALGAVVLAYGLIADPATVASHITFLAANLPPTAAELIAGQLEDISRGAGSTQGLGLIASLAIALFGARNGARALMTGLNIVFHADGSRSFIKGNLVAIAITAGGIAGLVVAGALAGALGSLAGLLGKLASMAVLALAAFCAASLIFRFAPNAPAPGWAAIIRGALFFAVLWLLGTAAFGFYAANFGSYNATYGALGAVLALITWFWLSSFLLLLGAEIVAQRKIAS